MFKPEDRVVVTDKYPYPHENLVGKVGTVIRTDAAIWPIEVRLDFDGDLALFTEEEVALERDCPADDH
jgi:hypothetical protein